MQKTLGYKSIIWRGFLITAGCLTTAWALTMRHSGHTPPPPAPAAAEWRHIGDDPWMEFSRLLKAEESMMPAYMSGRDRKSVV